MTEIWADLVASAILGTERRSFAPPAAGALGALLARIDLAEREGALLSAAAVVALYRRAGRLPPPADAPPAPACDPDDLPACSQRAAQHLAAMLEGSQRTLLPEWLAALAASGRRAPDSLLPDLLELGWAQSELREAILPILGKRGRWLATQNPDWSYASSELRVESSELLLTEWETGTGAARFALLRDLRKTAPALARDLVGSTWAAEKAEDRAAFLATFAIGLSMDDEPFLEGVLDDRSKEVRRTAADLLARLPESRFAARMLARVRPLLTWAPSEKPRLLGLRAGQPGRLEVALPDACDKTMIRDGVDPKLPANRKGLGEKAWWLLQMLCTIPPSTWTQGWDVTPAELIKAAERSEWKAVLHQGWKAAALAFRDCAWAEGLLHSEPEFADLLGVLPPERQEMLLLSILRADCTPLHTHPVLGLLRQTRHAWSVELTRAVLRAVHQHMRTWNDSYDYQLRGALTEDFARRIPPALIEEIAAGWPRDATIVERWQGVADRLLITLEFRRDMLRELHVT